MSDVPQESDGITNFLDSLVPREKRETISREAKWASIAIALVALFLQQFTLNKAAPILLDMVSGGGASFENYLEIIDVLMISLPFVGALTILLVLIGRGRLVLGQIVPMAILLLVGAAYLGNEFGFKNVDVPTTAGSSLQSLSNLFTAYLNAYGVSVFVSSFIVSFLFTRAYFILKSTE